MLTTERTIDLERRRTRVVGAFPRWAVGVEASRGTPPAHRGDQVGQPALSHDRVPASARRFNRCLITDGGVSLLWLDATYHKVRVDGRVVSQATAVAVGVTAAGERRVLGVDTGASEDGAFWTAFLAQSRPSRSARFAPGDLGCTRGAEASGRHGAARGELATVPRALHAEPAGAGATPDPRSRRGGRPDHLRATGSCQRPAQLEKVVAGLPPRFAPAATLLADAPEDLLAHKHSPAEHRTRLHSTNPLERLNKEIKGCASSGRFDGAGRRMGGGRPALLQRRIDAPAHAAAAPDDDGQALLTQSPRRPKRGRCGKPRRGLSKELKELRQRPRHQR